MRNVLSVVATNLFIIVFFQCDVVVALGVDELLCKMRIYATRCKIFFN